MQYDSCKNKVCRLRLPLVTGPFPFTPTPPVCFFLLSLFIPFKSPLPSHGVYSASWASRGIKETFLNRRKHLKYLSRRQTFPEQLSPAQLNLTERLLLQCHWSEIQRDPKRVYYWFTVYSRCNLT